VSAPVPLYLHTHTHTHTHTHRHIHTHTQAHTPAHRRAHTHRHTHTHTHTHTCLTGGGADIIITYQAQMHANSLPPRPAHTHSAVAEVLSALAGAYALLIDTPSKLAVYP
jgi:hypothetical protein